MKLSEYIKDKWAIISILSISCLAGGMFLKIMETPFPIICVALGICLLGVVLAAVYDYIRKAEYYRTLIHTVDELEEKTYLAEMVEEPQFYEGKLMYHIVRMSGKYQNDVIADQKRELQEYQEYVQTWAHEIKTPIAVARLVSQNNPGEATSSMEEEMEKVEDYVEQMLYYTKSSSLSEDYNIQPVSLKQLVMDAVKKNAKLMIGEGIKPDFGNLEYTVLADAKWMSFVIGQVLSNSVKYRAPERGSVISLDAGEEKGSVFFTVSDNGIGISQSDISRVFKKGFTGENGRAYKKSTGMGLYLCKNLCEKMGIGLTLESEKGKGTKVTFSMPAAHITKM